MLQRKPEIAQEINLKIWYICWMGTSVLCQKLLEDQKLF